MDRIAEIKLQLESLKKKQDFNNALPLLQELWVVDKTSLTGYDLAKCYRKIKRFKEARELHSVLQKSFNSSIIQNELLWLDYSEKIKDWKNDNLLIDALELLSKCDIYDKYSGAIYAKTVLNIVKFLIYEEKNALALEWLDKLDFTVLSNEPFSFNLQKYPSDKKAYFIRYADVLIKLNKHKEYIEKCLESLEFSNYKKIEFEAHISKKIAYNHKGGSDISRRALGQYLKYFKEELYDRKSNLYKSVYRSSKTTIISDLGNFLFCPVSFSINETFEIYPNSSWEKDEWLGEKRNLGDRYNHYQKDSDYSRLFMDTTIEINDELKEEFRIFFESKIIHNGADQTASNYFANSTDTLRGNPDYLFETLDGKKIVVVEKFTTSSFNEDDKAFSNDLVKIYGYMFELSSLNIQQGYLIYWCWHFKDVSEDFKTKKKIQIRNYKVFPIERSDENRSKLLDTWKRVEQFKDFKELVIDGNKISNPKKCLNCSVVSYCNHKTGNINLIKLPYDINQIQITKYPHIDLKNLGPEITKEDCSIDETPNV